MASPAKIPKEGEDAVEGFIYNVSPRRQSRNNSPYFTAVIQSARTEYHRVVVFSMEKQAIFSQAEKNGNAVRLRNVRRSISFSDPDGFDVLCSRRTSVEVTSLPFVRSVPVSCKAMTIAEVKALGPKQKVGEVHGKIRVHGCVNKVVSVNGMDCELKEVWICDRTGKIKVTLWDRFVNSAEVGKSYNFRNLCTRERDGGICLCTGPSSTIDQIADLEVEEGEGSVEEESTALCNAKIKGIAVSIQRKCSSCQYKQKEFVEKSTIHRCEGCKMKQESLRFSASFGGKAIVSSDSRDESVVLTSSALSTYLRSAGLTNLSNDSEAIEDHFLQSPAFDLKVNLDGFLLSIEATHPCEVGSSEAPTRALSAEDRYNSDAEGGAQLTEEGNVVVEEGNAVMISGSEA